MDSTLIAVSPDASYAELRAAQEKIQASLEEKRVEARNAALARIVSDVREFEFTSDELNTAMTGKSTKARKASTERKPVAPKYRNPANQEQTWTGRGVAPNWIKEFPREQWSDFLIEPVSQPAPEGEETVTADVAADETVSENIEA